jgi:hypothetical protein
MEQGARESEPLLILDAKLLFPTSGNPEQRHQLRQSNIDERLRNLRLHESFGRQRLNQHVKQARVRQVRPMPQEVEAGVLGQLYPSGAPVREVANRAEEPVRGLRRRFHENAFARHDFGGELLHEHLTVRIHEADTIEGEIRPVLGHAHEASSRIVANSVPDVGDSIR